MNILTIEEFFKNAKPTDAFIFTPEEQQEFDEFCKESDLRRDRNWSFLANKVVGAE